MHVDLGVGDGTNNKTIILDHQIVLSASEAMSSPPRFVAEWEVKPGSSIYIRAQFSGTLDTYNCLAYGLGG
jgi:hypothetical protein